MAKKTIDEILAIEPELQNVIDYAKHPDRKNEYWCNNYSSCKMMFQLLVGWWCQKEELKNSDDYETFLFYVLDIIESNSKEGISEETEDCYE